MNFVPRPSVLIYDGNCGFCLRWVKRWRHKLGPWVEFRPYQETGDYRGVSTERFAEAVHFFDSEGKAYSGAEAVFAALSMAPRGGWALWAYRRIPGFAPVSERAYRFVARHRTAFSRLTRWLWGTLEEPETFFLSRRIFLFAMGAVYLIAFASLWPQIAGLWGQSGVLPAKELLQRVSVPLGPRPFWKLPTLFWFLPLDASLHWACGAGMILSLLGMAGIWPGPVFLALWALYLSFVNIGQEFLAFQWDNLLLEAGFLAMLLAPWGIWPRPAKERPPSAFILLLLRWLLFRLMFQSGCVKLLSGDLVWRDWTALQFHYETQPLPNWIAWYVHHLPARFHILSTGLVFFVELALPFLLFMPRRPRIAAGATFILFQAMLEITGNYAYFNLLSIALCLPLFDDSLWRRFLPAPPSPGQGGALSPLPDRLRMVAGLPLLALSLILTQAMWTRSIPRRLAVFYHAFEPWRSVNNYGLFAVMTVKRPEIVIEGSREGKVWLPYEFRYKPGDPQRAPRFVAPHQPRLDWQMWFAALGNYQGNIWLLNLMGRILQGEKSVLSLLGEDPFKGEPPKLIRAVLYEYRFNSPAGRRESGNWWKRELKGLYAPVLALRPPPTPAR